MCSRVGSQPLEDRTKDLLRCRGTKGVDEALHDAGPLSVAGVGVRQRVDQMQLFAFDPRVLRTRCFHVKHQSMTLPAFGSFTGGFEINWNDGALFASGEQEVIPLNPPAKEMSLGTPQDPR